MDPTKKQPPIPSGKAPPPLRNPPSPPMQRAQLGATNNTGSPQQLPPPSLKLPPQILPPSPGVGGGVNRAPPPLASIGSGSNAGGSGNNLPPPPFAKKPAHPPPNAIPSKPQPPIPQNQQPYANSSNSNISLPPINNLPPPPPLSSMPPPPPVLQHQPQQSNVFNLPPPPPPISTPPPTTSPFASSLPQHLSLPPTILPPPPLASIGVTTPGASTSNSNLPSLMSPPPVLSTPPQPPQRPVSVATQPLQQQNDYTYSPQQSQSPVVSSTSSNFRNSTDLLAPPPQSIEAYPEINSQIRIAEENFNYLKEIYSKIAKRAQSSISCNREGHSLAESFKNYGTMLIAQSENTLGQCMFKVGDFQRDYEGFRNKVDNQAMAGLRGTVDQYINRDMKVVRQSKKNYEKIKTMYENVESKVISNASKGKGVNLVRQAELQQERDFLRGRVGTVGQESNITIKLAAESNAVELMEQVVEYIESVQIAVQELNKQMEQLTPSFQIYKKEAQKRRGELEVKIEAQKATIPSTNTPQQDQSPSLLSIQQQQQQPQKQMGHQPSIQQKRAELDVLPGEDQKKTRIKRLVSAERTYIHGLGQLVNVYLAGLRTDDRLFSKVFKEDEVAIFANIEPLFANQNKFLEELENSCLKTFGEPNSQSLAVAFARAAPKFYQLYSVYIRNFSKALVTINRCKASKNFQAFLKTCEEKSDGSDLDSLISLPLTRVTNYFILLQELKDANAQVNDPNDHSSIMSALEKIQQLCDLVGQGQSVIQLMKVQQSLIGYDSTLLEEGRFLIKEASASMSVGTGMPTSSYYFILLNDILIYCKKHNALFPVQILDPSNLMSPFGGAQSSSNRYKYVGKFELKSMDLKQQGKDDLSLSIVANGIQCNLSFDTKQQREEWSSLLGKAIAKSNQNKMFAIPLEQIYQRPAEFGRPIPSFLQRIVDYLYENGANEEGIFRLSANQRVLDSSKEEVENGVELDYSELDIHVTACLLKLWVRNLPEPLLTYRLFDQFTAIADIDSKQQRYQTMKQLVDRLPQENKFCLYYIMRLLTKISDNSATNKMTPNNISIVFATLLLKKKDASPLDCTSFNTIFGVIELFMTGFVFIFSDVEKQFSEHQEQQEHAKRRSVMSMKPLPMAPTGLNGSGGIEQSSMTYNNSTGNLASLMGGSGGSSPSYSRPQSATIYSDDEDDDDDEGFTLSNVSKQASITIQLGEIVKQGYLTKKGAMRRNWTKRWFVLKQNYLFYFKTSRDKKPKGIIQLVNVMVSKSFYKPFCMGIKSSTDKDDREFLICATSQAEIDEWIVAITKCSTKE